MAVDHWQAVRVRLLCGGWTDTRDDGAVGIGAAWRCNRGLERVLYILLNTSGDYLFTSGDEWILIERNFIMKNYGNSYSYGLLWKLVCMD